VYSTCLFCNNALGANEVVEAFPVGRRLAFDQARGRLWVVCRKCEKWNLSPLEERWEAIETCERFFHDTRKRVSTDNVGLARLDEGLELVRIGEPKRPEFAAWRYGDQFGRRFRKHLALTAATGMIGVGMLTAGPALGVLGTFAYLSHEALWWALWLHRRRRRVLDVDQHGTRLAVRASDADYISLVPQQNGEGWALRMLSGGRKGSEVVLSGAAALHATARIVPHLTHEGAIKRQTRAAVDRIEAAGDPVRFLNQLARNPQNEDTLSTAPQKLDSFSLQISVPQ
jgi:hypothetical protein